MRRTFKYLYVVILWIAFSSGFSQRLVVNEISQGPSGSKEYVELLVEGTASCTSDCMDLRGWIIDDNNGDFGAGGGFGIAAGCMRFAQDPIWACVKFGTIILVYNDNDLHPNLPPDNLSGAGCQFVIPASSTLFEAHTTEPSSGTGSAYPTTGFVSGGNWFRVGMRNGGDSFQTRDPANLSVAAHSVSYGDNTNPGIHFGFPANLAGQTMYSDNLSNNNIDDRNNWIIVDDINGTPGAGNWSANASWINSMSNNCGPAPSSLDVITSTGDVNCNGGADGTATVTPISGSAPYGYLWDTGDMTATVNGLSIGTYTVTVVDNSLCLTVTSVFISEPTALGVFSSCHDASTAGGSDGSSSATEFGGTPPYTYLWDDPNAQTTANAIGLSTGTYTVTVTDANGCQQTASCFVAEPSCTMVSTTTVTNPSCLGGSDGSISVSTVGGTPPYSYQWITGGTTPVETNLSAGIYAVTITEFGGGCTEVLPVNVYDPFPLVVSNGCSDASTQGGSDGVSGATASGGTAPYTYLWNDGLSQTTMVATGLIAGTYEVTVTDNNGCQETSFCDVNEPACGMIVSSTVTDISCFGQADGTAIITATNGTPPYGYIWPFGSSQSSVTGLSAGSYLVTVSDFGAGCVIVSTINVVEPSALSVNVNCTNTSMVGSSDGSSSATVTGGTSPYTYLWNDSQSQTSSTAASLAAGPYEVTVTDVNGCFATGNCVVNEASCSMTVNQVTTNPSCFGASDGSIVLTPIGGTIPYSYLWSSGNTTNSQLALVSGIYTATVTDFIGCIAVETITVTDPPEINVSMSCSNVSTSGGTDGTSQVTATGGASGYAYVWGHGGGTNTDAMVVGLSSGMYSVTVTDMNGCTKVSSCNVNEPAPPCMVSVTASSTDATCYGGMDGTASGLANGGVTPYTYIWDFGLQINQSITGLASGLYTVTVVDDAQCNAVSSVSVSSPPDLSVIDNITHVTCPGVSDGTIFPSISGGMGTYSYEWSTGVITPILAGVSDGVYTLTITSGNGCETVRSYTITGPSTFSVSSAEVPATCFGGCDGEATVTASPVSTYTYDWGANGNFQVASTAIGLCAGIYSPTITNSLGCEVVGSVTVSEPAEIIITNTATDLALCQGQCATINSNAVGGNGNYTYFWGTDTAQSISVCPTSQTDYTVTVVDGAGCFSVSPPVTINVGDTLLGGAFGDNTICNRASAFIGATASGGNGGPYFYAWNGGVGTGANVSVTPTSFPNPTDYIVTITDGCSDAVIDTVRVAYYNIPEPRFTPDRFEGCAPHTTAIYTDLNTVPDSSTCVWEMGDGTLYSGCDSIFHTFNEASTHTVSLTVISKENCINTFTWPGVINVFDNPTVDFTAEPNPTTVLNPDVSFTDESAGSIVQRDWSFYKDTGLLGVDFVHDPVFTFPLDTGLYPVNLRVTSLNGCVSDTTKYIRIEGLSQFYVPSAFTPNGDQVNDFFFPMGLGIDEEDFTMMIFNRWGELLFISRDTNDPWDGTARAKGNEKIVADGVYVWKITVKEKFAQYKKQKKYTGTVTLLR